MTALRLYGLLGTVLTPLILLWLWLRRLCGKEDRARQNERWGYAALPRPAGVLVWLHAASVGEAQSVLPLIHNIRNAFPEYTLLITTGTVSSAELLRNRLPEGVIHQFIPIDTPRPIARFLAHWQPNIALWVESELWPTALRLTHARGCPLWLINGRMSERSFLRWQRMPNIARTMLGLFHTLYAQSPRDQKRFLHFSATAVHHVGNLKYDALPLPYDQAALEQLQQHIGQRPVVVIASTHAPEERHILEAILPLRALYPQLLLVVIPRHAARGALLDIELRTLTAHLARRSAEETITQDTVLYLADTMGELGLFYRLADIVIMGGSFIPHGGQNPLEAARLSKPLLFGPHMDNFYPMTEGLIACGGALQVTDAHALTAELGALLHDALRRQTMGAEAAYFAEHSQGALAALCTDLMPTLQQLTNPR